MSMLD